MMQRRRRYVPDVRFSRTASGSAIIATPRPVGDGPNWGT